MSEAEKVVSEQRENWEDMICGTCGQLLIQEFPGQYSHADYANHNAVPIPKVQVFSQPSLQPAEGVKCSHCGSMKTQAVDSKDGNRYWCEHCSQFFAAPPVPVEAPKGEQTCEFCKVHERHMQRCHPVASPIPAVPSSTSEDGELTGFDVSIRLHTDDARQNLHHPEGVKNLVGAWLDKQLDLTEGVDYSLEVRRAYR